MRQSTNQNSDRGCDPRERHKDEQNERAWAEGQQRRHQLFKTSNYKEQEDTNPRRAGGTRLWALQSSEDPQDLGLSKLNIRKDKAGSSSNYHGPMKSLGAPAVENNVSQHHRNRVNPILGVSLNDLYKRDGTAVPFLLSQCFLAVEKFGLDTENIYCVHASVDRVNQIKSAFETGELMKSFYR